MRLTETSVAIRPRTRWEALDLGVLLAARYRRLLLLSWACITLPVYALLTLLLWQYPTLVILVMWWLKPAFERLPLFIVSQAIFEDPPTLGQALRRWPALLKPQLLASLVWRRLSLSRSFNLPVQQLERLDGPARLRRMTLLRKHNGGAARWLTLVGLHLEFALWSGLVALLYLLLPEGVEQHWSADRLDLLANFEGSWLGHLSNLFYMLVLLVWEPIYVACGFTLYLNRRTVLEAWDIELVLRNLRRRLGGVAGLALLACLLALPAPPAFAAPAPSSPRLLNQPLTSDAAHRSIQQITGQPPFKNPETVTRWRFGHDAATDAPKAAPASKPFDVGLLASAIELLLWAGLIAGAGYLLWRYADWLRAFVRRTRPAPTPPSQAPAQLFGLQVQPHSLPADVASAAEQLWPEQPREALGLLYRALLSRLLNDYQLPLKTADTESQVLDRVAGLGMAELTQFSHQLTRHWQNLAYGHQAPPDAARTLLCQGWRQLFDTGLQR